MSIVLRTFFHCNIFFWTACQKERWCFTYDCISV